jgi:hypothetical protein
MRPEDRTRYLVLLKTSNNLYVTIPARLSELTIAPRFNQNLLSAPPYSEQMCQFKEEINQICDFWPDTIILTIFNIEIHSNFFIKLMSFQIYSE